MKKTRNYIKTLIILLIFISCDSSSCGTTEKIDGQKFNLENYLTKAGFMKIKMEKMTSGHLYLFAQLNGVEGSFILDTGAGATVIEEKNKDKFKMNTQSAEEKATGVGGTEIQMQASYENTFKIESLEWTKQNLLLMDLDYINNAIENMGFDKVDGIIGSDILTDREAIIDYSNLILYLKKHC
jgi:hypothetical protein